MIKRCYIFSLLFFSGIFLKAQSFYPHDYAMYDFVKYDLNKLQFFEDSSKFEAFYEKCDRLFFEGEGKVNIFQFGGSHIQADIWSDRIRKHFINIMPYQNGGRGLFFPYTLAKTNNPYYYKVTYTGEWEGYRNSVKKHVSEFGLTGITAKTKDSLASFKIYFRGDDTPKYTFNKIKVLHNNDSTGYCIRLKSDTTALIAIDDSIGYTEFYLKSSLDTIEFEVYKTDSIQKEFALYGIVLENDDPGFVYTSIGVNGASVPSYLRCNLMEKHLTLFHPDLVIFSIGINDAYDRDFCSNCYESNYDSLISIIKTANPNVPIIFTTNNDSYYKRRYPNKNAELVRETMIKLAKKHGGAVWDMYGIMGGLGSIKTWQKHRLAKSDKIHLTKEGYELMGDLLFEAIIKAYNGHLESYY
jgi:lysophospholipase L1-like esterase